MIQALSVLKKNFRKIGILFLCLLFSVTVSAQTSPPSSAGATAGASSPPPSGPRPPNKWKTTGKKGGAVLLEVAGQWVGFQTVLAGHIYREYGTDWMFYKAPKNPAPGEEARSQYGWEAFKQFGVFYMASDVTTRMFNRFGGGWAKVAGSVGMGIGYFVSQLYTDFEEDEPRFIECAKDIANGKVKLDVSEMKFDFLGVRHIPVCEEAYLEWVRSGRWSEYLVDLGVMFGASLLSHGSIKGVQGGAKRVANLLRPAGTGTRALPTGSAVSRGLSAARLMRFLTPVTAFVVNLYTFIEINGVLDKTVGKYLKKSSLMGGISSDIHHLHEGFSQLTPSQLSFLTGEAFHTVLEAVNYVHKRKEEDKDNDDRSLYLKYLVNNQTGQELFTSVLYGLGEKELKKLKRRLTTAIDKEENMLSGRYGDSSNPIKANLSQLLKRIDKFEMTSEESIPKEAGEEIKEEAKVKAQAKEEATNVLEDIISQIKVVGFRFSRWVLIEGQSYQKALFDWKKETIKITETYTGAEELLGDIYDKTQSIDRFLIQMEKELEELEEALSIDYAGTELGRLMSGPSGQSEIDAHNKKIEAVKLKYHNLITRRLEFFTPSLNRLNEDTDAYLNNLCPYLDDKELREKVLLMQQLQSGGSGWVEWCERPGQVSVNALSLAYQTLPILQAMLEEKEPQAFQGSYEKKDLLKSYLSDAPEEIFTTVHIKKHSGDVQSGALSIAQADSTTKALVARALIEAVDSFSSEPLTAWEEVRRFFCSQSEEEQASLCAAWENMLSVSCFLEGVEDVRKCETALTQEEPDMKNYGDVWERASRTMKEKLAAGVFSLARDILSPSPEINPTMFYLTGFVEVYKGLEEQFAEDTSFASPDERPNSPYTFLHDFICGEPGGSVREGWFSAPQMVDFAFTSEEDRREGLSSICTLLNNNEVNTSNQEKASLILRSRYFHTPVTVHYKSGPVHYPSVYEMVEGWLIGDIDRSGRTKTAFLDYSFGAQTKDTLLNATEEMQRELKALRAEYIVPGLINRTDGRVQCLSLREYYLPEYKGVKEVSRGLLLPAQSVKIDPIEDQLTVLKGLGIYMFQIHFWMDWIRRVKLTTGVVDFSDIDIRSKSADSNEKTELSQFSPTGSSLDKVICKVLEWLKQYHDFFAGGSPLLPLTWEEAGKIKDLKLSEALLEISDKSTLNNNASVLIPKELMLSLILKAAYPSEWQKIEERLILTNLKPEKQKDALDYALVVELKKSIIGFYSMLNLLYLSEGMEKVTHRQESGLKLFQ